VLKLYALAFDAPVEQFEAQAEELLAAHVTGDAEALRVFHTKHPRFLDTEYKWLPKPIADSEIREAALNIDDARLAVARWYDFRDWAALADFSAAVAGDALVRNFESAVEAVVDGDLAGLKSLLVLDPELVRARSTRITHFDPPIHRCALLHYIGANGVEGFRQRTPPEAVAIARLLLEAGADPNATASLYGGECTTMSLLVSSCHPAQAGLQVALVDVLVDFGASVEALGEGNWRSPIQTALVFGCTDAAEALVRRGAKVNDLPVVVGLGRLADAERLLSAASAESRHMAMMLAAQLGRVEGVRVLLDAGEDPNRYNPKDGHAHTTPLHQAAMAGHEEVVRLLVERGALLGQKDKIYHSTPLGWAVHGGRTAVAEYLRSAGAE
jgi:ankyrin repeat protein